MSFAFRAPTKTFAADPPDTPYQRARQEWDTRMGSAVLSARAWRMTAFAGLGLAAALGVSLTLVALNQRTFVHVVEVSPEGQVMQVRAAEGGAGLRATPRSRTISAVLSVSCAHCRQTASCCARTGWKLIAS